MNTQIEQPNQPSSETEKLAGPSKMSRREALAIVGKHAVYTAPAVLAILSLTKTNGASAVESCPVSNPQC
jgi:hypothetical protein